MDRAPGHPLLSGILAVLAGAFVLLATVGSAQAQVKPGTADLVRVTGRVEVRQQGQTQWVPAVVGARLGERDEIRSFAAGSAELKLPDGSTLLLSENSRLVVNKLESDPQGQARTALFHLAVGKVRALVTKAAIALVRARQSNFAISTPTSVAAARGTDMVVSFDPARNATLIASLPEPASAPAPPGRTSEQFNRDESDCARLATPSEGGSPRQSSQPGERGAFGRCMASRGYEVEEVVGSQTK